MVCREQLHAGPVVPWGGAEDGGTEGIGDRACGCQSPAGVDVRL